MLGTQGNPIDAQYRIGDVIREHGFQHEVLKIAEDGHLMVCIKPGYYSYLPQVDCQLMYRPFQRGDMVMHIRDDMACEIPEEADDESLEHDPDWVHEDENLRPHPDYEARTP